MEGMREAGWLELGLGWGGVRSHPSNNPTYKLDCPWKVNGGVVVRLRREEDEVREGGERDSLQTEEETKNAVG